MLLAGYYVLRPLRDRMGIAGGVRALPWMFTATFLTLLVMQPLYGALVAKLPRARFIAIVYHFFAANLAVFWLMLSLGVAPVAVARVFFVWVSVFNLFAVAVFWSFMADLFDSEQGRRLFGFIGAGGTAGSLLGPLITIGLSAPLGPVNLLIAAIVLLELAVFCVHRLEHTTNARQGPRPEPSLVGGGAFAALPELFRSPYLLGVGAWVSLLSFGATILYLEQANIVAATVHGAGAQTRIFASIDLAVGLLTLATQVFATGQLLKRFGAGIAAGALPAVYVVGFAALALAPSLIVVVAIQVAQRWMNFAIANPARQVFFTVLSRGEKYKAKNLIDVVIYRGSDAFYGWLFGSLEALGLKIAAIALCALPVAAGWLVLSAGLGRAQERRAALRGGAGRVSMTWITRRDFAALAAVALLARKASAQNAAAPLITRAIPSSGERLPVVGLGTASIFDSDDERTRRAAGQVIRTLVQAGGRVIDTASSYGEAESVLGDVIAGAALRDKVFIATKLESPDASELKRSLARLKTAKIDLLQLHNVRDPQQSLAPFRAWKAQGLCRYIGITSTFHDDFPAVEAVLGRERPDFVQIDYSLDDREAEKRILPLAAEVKAGVLTALPFGRGRLFRAVHGQAVPEWAAGFAGSWAQFFLKYLLGDERVTAVIPGTSDPAHMADNLGAMRGVAPDQDQRRRMVAFIEAL